MGRTSIEGTGFDMLGSTGSKRLKPSGYDRLAQGAGGGNAVRLHLLARQLGGSGDVEENLVAGYHHRVNVPVLRGYELTVARAALAGELVQYEVVPLYGRSDDGIPRALRVTARGDRGLRIDVEIENTPEARVTDHLRGDQTPGAPDS